MKFYARPEGKFLRVEANLSFEDQLKLIEAKKVIDKLLEKKEDNEFIYRNSSGWDIEHLKTASNLLNDLGQHDVWKFGK